MLGSQLRSTWTVPQYSSVDSDPANVLAFQSWWFDAGGPPPATTLQAGIQTSTIGLGATRTARRSVSAGNSLGTATAPSAQANIRLPAGSVQANTTPQASVHRLRRFHVGQQTIIVTCHGGIPGGMPPGRRRQLAVREAAKHERAMVRVIVGGRGRVRTRR